MDGFPVEITTNILSRLPAKWVLSCRSVCKTWCSIIDNPHFRNTHSSSTQIEINDPFSFILVPSDYCVYFKGTLFIVEDASQSSSSSSSSSTQQGRIVKSTQISLSCSADANSLSILDDSNSLSGSDDSNSESHPLSLVGFSHGLICLFSSHFGLPDNTLYSFYICNPATQEYDTLPQAILPNLPFENTHLALGFGFSPSTNHFKVVVIFSSEDYYGGRNSEIQVYTIGSNSWRKVTADYPEGDYDTAFLPISGNPMVCVNGSLHWLAYFTGDFLQYYFRIISFDLALEDFGMVPNPQYLDFPDPFFGEFQSPPVHKERIHIAVLGGCLCLTDCGYQPYEYDIWVMKQYKSWTKQYVIRKDFMDGKYVLEIHPVIVLMNGDLVLVCDTIDSEVLFSYNSQKDTAIPIEDDQLPKCQDKSVYNKCQDKSVYYDKEITTFLAFPYAPSLISPKSICKIDDTFSEENPQRKPKTRLFFPEKNMIQMHAGE